MYLSYKSVIHENAFENVSFFHKKLHADVLYIQELNLVNIVPANVVKPVTRQIWVI